MRNLALLIIACALRETRRSEGCKVISLESVWRSAERDNRMSGLRGVSTEMTKLPNLLRLRANRILDQMQELLDDRAYQLMDTGPRDVVSRGVRDMVVAACTMAVEADAEEGLLDLPFETHEVSLWNAAGWLGANGFNLLHLRGFQEICPVGEWKSKWTPWEKESWR